MVAANMITHELLAVTPPWVVRSLERRTKTGALTLISAVCPDYEKVNGHYTYRNVGYGMPDMVRQHFAIVENIMRCKPDLQLTYHLTLADTEYDLPLVMKHLVGGDQSEFLNRCQKSCDAIYQEGKRCGLPICSAKRFTEAFKEWMDVYGKYKELFQSEVEKSSSSRFSLEQSAHRRLALYAAMSGQRDTNPEYAREMVLRQWAQYAAWGDCAERVFGDGIVMLNHTTPNLSRVNHPSARLGRERIPILQLRADTMP